MYKVIILSVLLSIPANAASLLDKGQPVRAWDQPVSLSPQNADVHPTRLNPVIATKVTWVGDVNANGGCSRGTLSKCKSYDGFTGAYLGEVDCCIEETK